MQYQIPKVQSAVQLIGPDQLTLNTSKKVVPPGPYQILCRVEAVGLCFSDLKLLKQFSGHARKTSIISGIEKSILAEIPSYMPDDKPTVPGHEAVVRVWAVGDQVTGFKPGQRYLVQTDYRWLPTANSNGSFGYNFEGALQEYVLMDQRVITSPQGESMLIPASEKLSAAAIALVEPWACVEDAYAVRERQRLKAGGKMLIMADGPVKPAVLQKLFQQFGRPAGITWVSDAEVPAGLSVPVQRAERVSDLKDAAFDDILYFGSEPAVVESLFAKLAVRGLMNIVLCGGRLGRGVVTYVGRVHYGGIRIIGTTGSDPAESMKTIPVTGEIRPGDKINVIGAGGPMGVMHVVRNVCQGIPDVTVYAGDLDDRRLALLDKITRPLADKNKVGYHSYHPAKNAPAEEMDYIVLMAPVPKLVVEAVKSAGQGGIVNIFAGIAATVTCEIDLQRYIEKQLYFIGTSGSTLDDMKAVLKKVESGSLDTNISVAAVSGLEGAVEGIRAVEKQLIPGKIIVYPACRGLGLTLLEELQTKKVSAAKGMKEGVWSLAAEGTLLEE